MIVSLKSIVPLFAEVSMVVFAVRITGPSISMLLEAALCSVLYVPPRCTPDFPLRVIVLNAPVPVVVISPDIFTVPELAPLLTSKRSDSTDAPLCTPVTSD